MEKWKTQKARFPLSHRARCREQRTEPKEANHKEGGLTVAFIQRQICTIKPRARCNLSARFFCHPSARHHPEPTRSVNVCKMPNRVRISFSAEFVFDPQTGHSCCLRTCSANQPTGASRSA